MNEAAPRYCGYGYPPEIISHAVWLYYRAIGPIVRGVIVVVFTEIEDEIVRIISARPASKREIVLYRKHAEG